ncbi:MAG: cyclodeaminase/cyclohydrolase family protein [Candidatus Omnitrophica bacterium]|nr:cyclodeaminase/cyclohydrolase family protein [Candidatus Omnitrophota bacterium]
MTTSLEQFLDRTADRRSRYGGGSCAAFTCALASALLEKLIRGSGAQRSRTIRQACLRLVEEDAKQFALVLEATTANDRVAFAQALKAAIEIPQQVHAHAQQLLRLAGRARSTIQPRYRVDLVCVTALAAASGRATRALVRENLRWLRDPGYARRTLRRLRQASAHVQAR